MLTNTIYSTKKYNIDLSVQTFNLENQHQNRSGRLVTHLFTLKYNEVMDS